MLLNIWEINRAAVECEKKTRAANIEQSLAMEKHMKSLQREIEMLHAELANAEKRARAAAAASNPSMHFPALCLLGSLLCYDAHLNYLYVGVAVVL